jgi:hypothetical protein
MWKWQKVQEMLWQWVMTFLCARRFRDNFPLLISRQLETFGDRGALCFASFQRAKWLDFTRIVAAPRIRQSSSDWKYGLTRS